MTRAQLYSKVYTRFVKLHKLTPNTRAISDITNGTRMIFGVGMVYHSTHTMEWIKLITPLFQEDIDFIFDKMGYEKIKECDTNSLFYAIHKATLNSYLYNLIGKQYSILEFCQWYRIALKQEIKFNH